MSKSHNTSRSQNGLQDKHPANARIKRAAIGEGLKLEALQPRVQRLRLGGMKGTTGGAGCRSTV